MSDPLWERLLVAATGPVITAGLAIVVLNVVTSRAQRRREEGDTRDMLATELTETANPCIWPCRLSGEPRRTFPCQNGVTRRS